MLLSNSWKPFSGWNGLHLFHSCVFWVWIVSNKNPWRRVVRFDTRWSIFGIGCTLILPSVEKQHYYSVYTRSHVRIFTSILPFSWRSFLDNVWMWPQDVDMRPWINVMMLLYRITFWRVRYNRRDTHWTLQPQRAVSFLSLFLMTYHRLAFGQNH